MPEPGLYVEAVEMLKNPYVSSFYLASHLLLSLSLSGSSCHGSLSLLLRSSSQSHRLDRWLVLTLEDLPLVLVNSLTSAFKEKEIRDILLSPPPSLSSMSIADVSHPCFIGSLASPALTRTSSSSPELNVLPLHAALLLLFQMLLQED
ncbi:hypothetical protein HA466_0146530 [Hirschfeldia incana]|nr:hypothetical protein HA466_0146530 [Hirschfeldia incana]KAJ0249103.1 hypothetical protein HA466_0146530 [Hirschfeldia incana]KAJ0249104.1 hypothetical protein HA466_0146530 [Hirschfeldia incana]